MFGATSPALPWEVIERVIGHSAGRTRTLYSFALTCRQLNPRSTILLFYHVKLKDRDRSFDLCDVLQAKPHLQRCVRSIWIPIDEFSPHPLLRMLPHLSEIEFDNFLKHPTPHNGLLLHSSVLRCCHQTGQHIQSLSLRSIMFRSLSDFSAILMSFPNIQSLSCANVNTKDNHGLRERNELTARLSKRLKLLRTLAIDAHSSNMVLKWLVEAHKHKIASLTYDTYGYSKPFFDASSRASPSDWLQLTSFTWKIRGVSGGNKDGCKSTIKHLIRVLEDFRPTNLQEVTIVFRYDTLRDLVVVALPSAAELCAELERSLIMKFPTSTVLFSPSDYPSQHINSRRYHSWSRLLGRFFPVLAERYALGMDAELSGHAGHDDKICTPIVISADSRWAATGSADGTIIIWDLERPCIYQEWFIERSEVNFLAFSPDSRYIMSVSSGEASRGQEATIWDVHQRGRQVRLLLGGGNPAAYQYINIRCAWSPDGSWIAAGPQGDGTTHIWETATFQRLHSHTTWEGGLLVVSPDGHWVATAVSTEGGYDHDCWIWNVESGNLHRSLVGPSHTQWVSDAAFDQGCIRIVTGSYHGTISIWDIESGEQLLILEEQMKTSIFRVAFSEDGAMVLSHSGGEVCNAAVWDASSGTLLASFSQLHHDRDFRSNMYLACFLPCGSYVASGSYGDEVLLWRVRDWSCVAEVSGRGTLVTHIAISPDGRVLCWVTEDGRVFFRRMDDLISPS